MSQINALKKRNIMLIIGVASMLFAGIIYAWSILKAPLTEEFSWDGSALALNFTLTMCAFCLGGFGGSFLSRKIGVRASVIIAGIAAGLGFVLTGLLSGGSVILLYLTYALMAGGGIGVVYNVVISAVSAWFPDKKGFCSGCLMMGFGASSLLLGNLASVLFDLPSVGWRATYIIIGIALGAALAITGLLLERPGEGDILPEAKIVASKGEDFEIRDYSPIEMLRRFSFWRAFILLICLTAVGSSVISFARDLALSVGADAGLATTLVGVLSVCNGLGRIITGKTFDLLGRRKTMLAANILTIVAAGATLLAVYLSSLPLCIIGLCLTGMSYGASPTVSSAFTSAFYGAKHFPTNFSIMNFNLMAASFVATACSSLLSATGGYTAPFILLLGLSSAALVLNISIKKP
nr:OFA family MFS transporter [Oscillospiraceae bacterium]